MARVLSPRRPRTVLTVAAVGPGMERVHADDAAPAALGGTPSRRDVSRALGATDVVVMYYQLDPGEPFSAGYHAHHTQEEAFYVLEGRALFDTERGTVAVAADEVIRFEPGEFQQGYADPDCPAGVVALALGAPPGMDDTVIVHDCEPCGERTPHDVELDEAAGWERMFCRACDNRVVVIPEEDGAE